MSGTKADAEEFSRGKETSLTPHILLAIMQGIEFTNGVNFTTFIFCFSPHCRTNEKRI